MGVMHPMLALVGVKIFTTFWATILFPDMLKRQSRSLKTWMVVEFPTKVQAKKMLIGLAPMAG